MAMVEDMRRQKGQRVAGFTTICLVRSHFSIQDIWGIGSREANGLCRRAGHTSLGKHTRICVHREDLLHTG